MEKNINSTPPSVLTAVREFMKLESAAGIPLLAAAVIAMLVANSPLAALYDSLLGTTVAVQVGAILLRWMVGLFP